MFCRLGSFDEMRPVAATAWPHSRVDAPGLRVDEQRAARRCTCPSASRAGGARAGCRAARAPRRAASSTSASVERAVLVRLIGFEPELVEEHRLELARRAHVELAPRGLARRFSSVAISASTRLAQARELGDVDEHADALHLGEHARERQLDVVQDVGELAVVRSAASSDRRAAAPLRPRSAAYVGGALHVDLVEAELSAPRSSR